MKKFVLVLTLLFSGLAGAAGGGSGSRMMPEKKPEAAALGKPGRTQIVGKRRDSPSMNPLRAKSETMNSQAAFWAP